MSEVQAIKERFERVTGEKVLTFERKEGLTDLINGKEVRSDITVAGTVYSKTEGCKVLHYRFLSFYIGGVCETQYKKSDSILTKSALIKIVKKHGRSCSLVKFDNVMFKVSQSWFMTSEGLVPYGNAKVTADKLTNGKWKRCKADEALEIAEGEPQVKLKGKWIQA